MSSEAFLRRFFLLALFASLSGGRGAWAGEVQKAEDKGVAVELALAAVAPASPAQGSPPLPAGETIRVHLRLSDAGTRSALSGVYPAGWLTRLSAGETSASQDAAACKTKAETFVSGSLLNQPDADLNSYYVLTLNEDGTISVIDPLFGFGGSQLLTLIFLPGPGGDWVLSADEQRLFVSVPATGEVAVIATDSWKVLRRIAVGPGAERLVLQPDGHYLWVGTTEGVAAIATDRLEVQARVATARGARDLAAGGDSRQVFVTSREAGTVSVIDVRKLARVADLPVCAAPVAIDYSAAAQAAWIACEGDGAVVAVTGGDAPKVAARIQTAPGLHSLRFAPGGRLAFLTNPQKNTVTLIDAARQRLIATAEVEAEPDQVTFTDTLAYVRHRGSDSVLMIPLQTVGEPGQGVAAADFPGGQSPPGKIALPTPAAGIVQAPGANAVLVANPADQLIYFYKEGMAAPMGSFKNYGRQPRAVLALDRSLRPRGGGLYESFFRVEQPGSYDLVLFLDSPRLVKCFPVTIAENPALRKGPPVAVEPLLERRERFVGEEVVARFRLSVPETRAAKAGLHDVRALAFLSPGIWQQRPVASEVEPGLYEIHFTPPQAGVYFLFLEAPSVGLSFQKSAPLTLEVLEKAAPVEPPSRR